LFDVRASEDFPTTSTMKEYDVFRAHTHTHCVMRYSPRQLNFEKQAD